MDEQPAGERSENFASPYLPVGAKVGPYRIESFLDRGGMAFVYQATDERLGRQVALKVLSSELASGSDFRERFLRESHFAASLDHPNIVPVYDAGDSEGLLYIAMRFVRGRNLDTLLKQSGRLEPRRALTILAPVADALDSAHAAGLIHRDVKPANILMSLPNGREGHEHVYLSDFGVTKSASAFTELTATGFLIGTMSYIAPEQIKGEPLNARSDLYAFGCVAYQCLTGVAPFVRDEPAALLWAHLSAEPLPLSHHRSDLAAADTVMARALAKDPTERFETCEQFVEALSEALLQHRTDLTEVMSSDDSGPRWADGATRVTAFVPPADAAASGPGLPSGPHPVPGTANEGHPGTPSVGGPGFPTHPPARPPAQPVAAAAFAARPPGSVPPGSSQPGSAAPGSAPGLRPPGSLPPGPPGGPPPGAFGYPARRTPRALMRKSIPFVLAAVVVIGLVITTFVVANRSKTQPAAGASSTSVASAPVTSPAVASSPGSVAGSSLSSVAVSSTPSPASPTSVSSTSPSLTATSPGTKGNGPPPTSSRPTVFTLTPTFPVVRPLPAFAIPTIAGKALDVGPTPGYIAIAPNGRFAYIANGNAKIVTVIDLTIDQVIAKIPISSGPPQYIAFAPDGATAYVSVYNDAKTINMVAILDTRTTREIGTIPVDKKPYALAVTPDERFVYVPSHDTGSLDVIDVAKRAVVKRISVAKNPHWVAFSRDGKIAYIANHESNVLSVLDVATNQILTTIPVGTSPHSVSVSPDGTQVGVVCYDSNDLFLIDTTTRKVVGRVPVGDNPRGVVWSADGKYLYSANESGNTVSVIDAARRIVTANIPTGAPSSIALTPDGSKAYVTNLEAGTVTILNTAG